MNDDIFIVKQTPSYYSLQTNPGYCGPHQIKTIVESHHGKHDKHVKHYTANTFGKYMGGMKPWIVYRILKKHGFHPKIGFLIGRQSTKVAQIKKKLQAGPVILLIGHAYNHKYKFHLLRALLFHHYVSIWGYNEKEKIFYAYDSNPDRAVVKNIPIGNSIFTYKEIIQYGQFPVAGLMRNLYISLG